MATIHLPAALQINADTAGRTGVAAPPTAHAVTAVEQFAQTVRTDMGGLGYLFGHDIIHAVETPLDRATQAVRGVAGGLVPTHETNISGNATPPVVGRAGAISQLRDQARVDLGRFRKALGL